MSTFAFERKLDTSIFLKKLCKNIRKRFFLKNWFIFLHDLHVLYLIKIIVKLIYSRIQIIYLCIPTIN